jgi:hypothetical protein
MEAPPPWSYGAFAAVLAPFFVRFFADDREKRLRAATEKSLQDAGIARVRSPGSSDAKSET